MNGRTVATTGCNGAWFVVPVPGRPPKIVIIPRYFFFCGWFGLALFVTHSSLISSVNLYWLCHTSSHPPGRDQTATRGSCSKFSSACRIKIGLLRSGSENITTRLARSQSGWSCHVRGAGEPMYQSQLTCRTEACQNQITMQKKLKRDPFFTYCSRSGFMLLHTNILDHLLTTYVERETKLVLPTSSKLNPPTLSTSWAGHRLVQSTQPNHWQPLNTTWGLPVSFLSRSTMSPPFFFSFPSTSITQHANTAR